MVAKIKLVSSDEIVFEVETEVAKMSTTINNLLTDLGIDENDEEAAETREPIPIQNVTAAMMTKVIEWCTKHKGEPAPEEPTDNRELKTDDISDWDKQFLGVSDSERFRLILAANYLDIKGLLDVTCKFVAHSMKGLPVTELRTKFNIENDFTAEEEEQIRKENAWCED